MYKIRTCNFCGDPMSAGYSLRGQHACCDKCAIELYDGAEHKFREDLANNEIHYKEWENFLEDDGRPHFKPMEKCWDDHHRRWMKFVRECTREGVTDDMEREFIVEEIGNPGERKVILFPYLYKICPDIKDRAGGPVCLEHNSREYPYYSPGLMEGLYSFEVTENTPSTSQMT